MGDSLFVSAVCVFAPDKSHDARSVFMNRKKFPQQAFDTLFVNQQGANYR